MQYHLKQTRRWQGQIDRRLFLPRQELTNAAINLIGLLFKPLPPHKFKKKLKILIFRYFF